MKIWPSFLKKRAQTLVPPVKWTAKIKVVLRTILHETVFLKNSFTFSSLFSWHVPFIDGLIDLWSSKKQYKTGFQKLKEQWWQRSLHGVKRWFVTQSKEAVSKLKTESIWTILLTHQRTKGPKWFCSYFGLFCEANTVFCMRNTSSGLSTPHIISLPRLPRGVMGIHHSPAYSMHHVLSSAILLMTMTIRSIGWNPFTLPYSELRPKHLTKRRILPWFVLTGTL